MRSKQVSIAITMSLLLSGCALPNIYDRPVPHVDVGRTNDGWRPYVSPEVVHSENRGRHVSYPDWGSERPVISERTVHREALSPVDLRQSNKTTVVQPTPSEDGSLTRVEPKDPPSDLSSRRRAYSSRPERNAQFSSNDSAFSRPSFDNGRQASRWTVRSEWADKTVSADDRPAFDRMVQNSASLGKGSFEDKTGRVYYAQPVGREGSCALVEVTVTTQGGLPVIARGIAYSCR